MADDPRTPTSVGSGPPGRLPAPPAPPPPPPLPPSTGASAGPPPGAPGTPELDEPRWGLGDVGISILVFLAAQIAAGMVLIATGIVPLDTETDAVSDTMTDLGLGGFAVTVVFTWIGFMAWPVIASRVKGYGSLRRDFGLAITWRDAGVGLLVGGGVIAVAIAVGVLYTILSGDEPPTNAGVLDVTEPSPLSVAVLFALVAVGTPIVEELYFRGFLLRALAKRWTVPVGVVVSAIAFGVLHVTGQGIGDLWIIGLLTILGYVLAVLTVRRSGRLGAAMVAHGVNNGFTVVAFVLTEAS